MRNLLQFGLFALALTAVSQASADDDSDYRRGKRVVVRYDDGPRQVRPVRATVDPPRAIYDQRRTFHNRASATRVIRQDYVHQLEDLEQIVRISQRWERATATRNTDAQWRVNRRLDAWLEREIRESVREPRNQRYTQQIRSLRDELTRLERRRYRGYGYRKRGQGGYAARKALILNELVRLSERQVQRAAASLHYPYRLSFARR